MQLSNCELQMAMVFLLGLSKPCALSAESERCAVLAVQISKDELQTAMGFLSEQLGADELRHLLERLNAFSDDATTPINVNSLMALAAAENGPPSKAAAPGS